jgi:hypothetical protein
MTTYHDSHSACMNINDWIVELVVDSDGHLNVYINHKDKSPVIQCDIEGMAENDEQWAERFTTVGIESDYSATQPTNQKGTK